MCGVVGIYSKDKDISKQLYYSLYSIQHRGQESCGLAVSNGEEINYYKDMGLVGDVFTPKKLEKLQGNMGIAHVRYSTAGGSNFANCQPLLGSVRKRRLALAHNGNLVNAQALKDMLEEDGYMFTSNTDTEVILYILARYYKGNIVESLKLTMDYIKGAYSLVIMSDDELKALANRLKIVARAKPTDKSRLVRIFKELNLVVGMTGDGINDAAALKKCDVGFAMGSGADVAKEAADIVILDDNICSISMAILFGRTIFKNIRKFIIFQLTVNICAMSLSIIGPFIGISTPVTVMQMLWINMIMDSLASLAFAYDNPNKIYMNEKPKDKDEHIINKYMYDVDNKYFLTAFFTLFVFIGIFNAFNARTSKLNLFSNILGNKVFMFVFLIVGIIQIYFIYYGGSLFRTYGLTLKELLICLGLAFTVIPFDLLRKYLIGSKDYV